MTNPKQDWQGKFDEKFLQTNGATIRWQVDGVQRNNERVISDAIKSFISQLLLSNNKRLAEKVRGMKKEQLDKDNPDNYGACYAIAGFNKALEQAASIIEE